MFISHECHVSELIDKLVDVAADEKDKASQDFLWGFVREQVEEEATVQGIVDKSNWVVKRFVLFRCTVGSKKIRDKHLFLKD